MYDLRFEIFETFFHDYLRLERMKLKNPDTNDHERNVSTNVLEIVLERQIHFTIKTNFKTSRLKICVLCFKYYDMTTRCGRIKVRT